MSSLQDWVYNAEAGPLRAWLVRIAIFLLVLGLSAFLGIREFNGLRTFEAMDLAQQARQLVEGKGLTTLVIRPLALWQLRGKMGNQAPSVTNFPETLTPPLYPFILAISFKAALAGKLITFDLPPEALQGFRNYPPDLVVLVLQLFLVVASSAAVYAWAQKQFDLGTGVLAVIFFLGSSPLWSSAVSGGATLLAVFCYALAGWLLCQGLSAVEQVEENGYPAVLWPWFFGAGFIFGITPLVQVVHIWAVLAALGLVGVVLRRGAWSMGMGLILAGGLFLGWLLYLWLACKNPIGLNWAFLLADSSKFPGEVIWRTYTFDIEKTDVWRRVGGSIVRGCAELIQSGPALIGNMVAGTLALVGCLHAFRRPSAARGKAFWVGAALVLIIATAFVQRPGSTEGHPILLVLLPFACVYGAAYLWVLIERWKIHLELVGQLFAMGVALVAVWPTLARIVLPPPPPFAYPPTYPPIFLFMRSWFEPGELQASDLPAAEAWYTDRPTLWIPHSREDFLKIHDRVEPVFSILFTPKSSDVLMYSQMLSENSEWEEWADLIRRQKPADLPQAFVTALPPNNDYLLFSTQKRWQ